MKKATVIIPNFNGIKYIADCLDSLFQLKEQALFQVVMVDNGSKDGSLELVKLQYPQVQIIAFAENTGFDHAVNAGIRQADTPYVILLNNDTVVLEGFVEELIKAIEEEERLFSVSSCMLMWQDHQLVDDAGDRYCALGWAYARGKGKPALQYDKPAEVFSACAGAAIYRKTVFEEIGLFDEAHFAYLEDIDIGYRAMIYGYKNRYTPKAKVLHAGSATSGSRYNVFKTSLASANSVYLIGKNMPLLQVIWNLPFLLAGFLIKTCFFTVKGMGVAYVKGLFRGLKMCFGTQGKENKVAFQRNHLKNYLKIQALLYLDIFRMIGGK